MDNRRVRGWTDAFFPPFPYFLRSIIINIHYTYVLCKMYIVHFAPLTSLVSVLCLSQNKIYIVHFAPSTQLQLRLSPFSVCRRMICTVHCTFCSFNSALTPFVCVLCLSQYSSISRPQGPMSYLSALETPHKIKWNGLSVLLTELELVWKV
jgi:hypothetical protein